MTDEQLMNMADGFQAAKEEFIRASATFQQVAINQKEALEGVKEDLTGIAKRLSKTDTKIADTNILVAANSTWLLALKVAMIITLGALGTVAIQAYSMIP
jgi:hypothetical protein